MSVPLGPNQCLSAHFVDQAESLEGADPSCNCLLVGSGDDLLDGEVKEIDGADARENHPVDFFEQVGVWPAVKDQTKVCKPDEHHPPDEAEEEGVEVGADNHVP